MSYKGSPIVIEHVTKLQPDISHNAFSTNLNIDVSTEIIKLCTLQRENRIVHYIFYNPTPNATNRLHLTVCDIELSDTSYDISVNSLITYNSNKFYIFNSQSLVILDPSDLTIKKKEWCIGIGTLYATLTVKLP